jgi:hypothetical protein
MTERMLLAGERSGRIYEAIVVIAIESHAPQGASVHWNVEVPRLMVKPDVLIGTPQAPKAIGLITRAGSRRDWHKKFWRNVGETVDVKSVFPATRLISINLGTEPKEELVAALERVVDVVVFPSRPVREKLEEWVASIESGAPKDADALLHYVRRELKRGPRTMQISVDNIGRESCSSLTNRTDKWAPILATTNTRSAIASVASAAWHVPPSLRRGLSKLLVFGEPGDVLSQISPRGVLGEPLGTAMADFGWAAQSIAGWRITDGEIGEVMQQFDAPTLRSVLDSCISPEMRLMCRDVASPTWLNSTAHFLKNSYLRLSDASTLALMLIDSHGNAKKLNIAGGAPSDLPGSWLYRALSCLLKAASGKKQGFGYEQLVADIRALRNDSWAIAFVKRAGATDEDIRKAGSTDSLRRKLVDWVSGLSGEKRLVEWQVTLVAQIVSKRVLAITPGDYLKACEKFPTMMRRLTYEDRITPYAYFEPLPYLIRSTLSASGLEHRVIERLATMFSDSSPSAREVATCQVIISGAAVIHWKSASELGRDHKTKELCGRGFALRHVWTGKAIDNVADLQEFILVLDGDFTASDVEHLVRAGWDRIVSSRDVLALPDILSNCHSNSGNGSRVR